MKKLQRPDPPKVKVVAKKSAARAVKKMLPLCPRHKTPMAYSPELGYWFCADQGCPETRKADVHGGAGSVTRINDTPRLVLRYDEDGDAHAYLLYAQLDIMIELPYSMLSQTKVYDAQSTNPTISVELVFADFTVLDKNDQAMTIEQTQEMEARKW